MAKKAKVVKEKSIEDRIWDSANKLRGNLTASEYQNVVLGLVFLKYISDCFEKRYNELVEEGDGFEEDRDEYTAEHVFWVPKDARWQVIASKAHDPQIGQVIDHALEEIGRENPRLKKVMPNNYSRPEIDKIRLGEVVEIFDNMDMHAQGEGIDLFGRVYEYCLQNFAAETQSSGGEFYTPSCIVRTIVEVLQPFEGRVYDPACGSGGMFVQSAKFIQQHQGNLRNVTIYGQEFNANTWKMAHMNLAIRGLEADLGDSWGDSFGDDKHATKKFDFIMANPPFNMKDWGASRLADDVRWKYGVPPEGNANYAWIQHMVHHLSPTGRIGLVLANGSLTTTSGGEGDLVPLAHLCLPIVGLGEVEYKGELMSGADLCKKMGWEPVKLGSKEGLALLNGTQNMSAHAVWAMIKAERLSKWADVIAAISLEAYDGRVEPFTHAVHAVRPHQGQIETAARMRELLDGSELIKQPKVNVQDPYSFRCIPQVHGSVKDTIRYVGSVIDTEINSATDNPTVCPDEDLIISAGNFHGEPIAMPMDFLCIAMAELGNISERRTYKLVSGTRDLPSFLVAQPGVNSGFMIPQYTAAAIASQSKTLCMPSSADTIPTSQGQEDHVSMGANAGVKLCKVVENTERVLAIELFNAAQALEFRRPLKSSAILEHVFADYRKVVPFINEDQPMYPHIAKSVEFLQNNKID